MKKPFLALATIALAISAQAALAATHFLVTPLASASQAPPESEITVSLAEATLAKARLGRTYNESLGPLLSVTGDPAFNAAQVGWSLAGTTLPAGLALDASGTISGTPSALNEEGQDFTIMASYKGKDGQQVYTIKVGEALLDATQLAVGASHSCALTTEGSVKCWGLNSFGQLGNGTKTESRIPVDVVGLGSGVASLSTGAANHTCVALTSGAARCWGYNYNGQLGDGNTGSAAASSVPVPVSGLGAGVVTVITGTSHSCALTTAGGVKCWGINNFGQLGDNTFDVRLAPVDVHELQTGVVSIASGESHVCARTAAGGVKCWGYNNKGQLGNDSTTNSPVPVDVVELKPGIASVSAGFNHTCAVTSSGAAQCWGYNHAGQLGNNSATDSPKPVDVSTLGSGVAMIAGGSAHTCAVMTGGAAKCWGNNYQGALGVNDYLDRNVPVDVLGLGSGVVTMKLGAFHTCAVTDAGLMKCWGLNSNGQLGNNSTVKSPVPVNVRD